MHPAADSAMRLSPAAAGILWGAFAIRRLHRSGVLPQRVLVVGSRSLLDGHDRRTAIAQLTEDLTDRLWLSTRRGVDLDVVLELRHLLRSVLRGVTRLRISRYDVVVLLTEARSGRAARLAAALLAEMSPTGRFLSVALDDAGTGTTVGSALPWREPRSAAAAIVRRLQIPLLDRAGRIALEQQRHEDSDRDDAVESLGLADRGDDDVLQRLVEQAGDRFDARFAELNIVGRDEQWSLAAAGLPRGARSKEGSLCDLAIQRSGPTVFQDTLRELSLDEIPRLTNGRLVRFYAGHPIQSVDGHRVGVLCVYDTRPHRFRDSDVTTLRDLALLAEARVVGV